jgi:hypothetical protein
MVMRAKAVVTEAKITKNFILTVACGERDRGGASSLLVKRTFQLHLSLTLGRRIVVGLPCSTRLCKRMEIERVVMMKKL